MPTSRSGPPSADPRPGLRCLRLDHAGLRLDVECDDVAVLGWLAEFLGPAFAVPEESDADPDRRVGFRVAAGDHARLRAQLAAAPPREIDGFTQDGSFSRHPFFACDGSRWLHDPAHDVFIGIGPGARRVEVVAPDADPRQRLLLMRVVRELATAAAHRLGQLPVHAAAFVLGGGAVLVCGPKRAGKSSVLVHALERGAGFLSNDRVQVSLDGEPRARGMPTIVMLRNGTLARFDALRREFERAAFDRARTLAECAPGVSRPAPRAGAGFDRPGISPPQLCRLLGARLHREAPVRALLFPRVDPEARGVQLVPLGGEVAAELLAGSLLKPSEPARLSEAFAPGEGLEPVPRELEALRRRRLAAAAPAFRCRLGPDAYQADLLSALRPLLPR